MMMAKNSLRHNTEEFQDRMRVIENEREKVRCGGTTCLRARGGGIGMVWWIVSIQPLGL